MCGRYYRRSDKQRIAEAFQVTSGVDKTVLPPWDYNVAPTTHQPVIRADRDTGERQLALMRWGLVPYFAKDLKSFAFSTINARAESLTTSPIFRGPFERHRCLVPADGFYEWKKLPAEQPAPKALSLFGADVPRSAKAGKKTPGVVRTPYAFSLSSGAPFVFAGLWDRWKDPAGGVLESYTIITTTPNELAATVHDRMPVILRPQDYDLWLSRPPRGAPKNAAPPLELLALLRPYPADRMTASEAHPDVGNVKMNHPGLLNSA